MYSPSRNAQIALTTTRAHRLLRSHLLLTTKAPRRSNHRLAHATGTAIHRARSSPIRPMARALMPPWPMTRLTGKSPPRPRKARMPPATRTAPIQTREARRTRCMASSQRPLGESKTPTREEAASPTLRSSRVERCDRAAPRGIHSTAPHKASIKTQRARLNISNQDSQKSRNEGPRARQPRIISTQTQLLNNNSINTSINSNKCNLNSSHKATAGIRANSGSFRITLWYKNRQLATTINRNNHLHNPLNSLSNRNF